MKVVKGVNLHIKPDGFNLADSRCRMTSFDYISMLKTGKIIGRHWFSCTLPDLHLSVAPFFLLSDHHIPAAALNVHNGESGALKDILRYGITQAEDYY